MNDIELTKKEKKAEYMREWRIKNAEKIIQYSKDYHVKNIEKRREYLKQNSDNTKSTRAKYKKENAESIAKKNKEYREANREKRSAYNREYRNKNIERVSKRIKSYKKENAKKIYEGNLKYREANIEKIRANKRKYQSSRKAVDFVFSIKERIKTLVCDSLRNKGYTKNSRTHEILGCDYETFIAHLESQFKDGMNWENRSKWHIDHIIPLASAKTESEVLALNHYTNLQPLWAVDNIKKGAKMPQQGE
jgi:hypothetical protein